MIRLFLVAIALVSLSSNAEARQHHRATGMSPECNISMPCVAPYDSSPEAVRITRGKFIARDIGIGGPVETHVKRVPKSRQLLSYNVPIGYSIRRPARYIAGRLICAINVNAALAERGIRGTGSALAHSFDSWGNRSPVPIVGGVAVTDRRGGGHVALVSRVEGSRVFVWNPSPRGRGWQEMEYTNRHARYRVAG